MADTLEQRLSDVERMLAHLPEDLDARFAGVDVKLAELREVLALHTTRFSKLEAQLNDLAHRVDGRLGALDGKVDDLAHKLDGLAHKVDGLEHKVDASSSSTDGRLRSLESKVDEILQRLPPKP